MEIIFVAQKFVGKEVLRKNFLRSCESHITILKKKKKEMYSSQLW